MSQTQYINLNPNVAGWGGQEANISAVDKTHVSTSNGVGLITPNKNVVEGFSTTENPNNMGYYLIDCEGQYQNAVLNVDMYIATPNSSGEGLWYILASNSIFNGKQFPYDTFQVWQLRQNLSTAGVFTPVTMNNNGGSGWMSRICMSIPIVGSFNYIYICGIDLGQGRVAISLNDLSVTVDALT